jgi:hypothetical protein
MQKLFLLLVGILIGITLLCDGFRMLYRVSINRLNDRNKKTAPDLNRGRAHCL